MTMSTFAGYVMVGLAGGLMSGFLGIGGGIIMVPALVLLFGFSQQMAQGTTLALMVPPIGLLAAIIYYRRGFVDLKVSGIICVAFVVASILGAQIATHIPQHVLRKAFSILLFLISIKMFLGK